MALPNWKKSRKARKKKPKPKNTLPYIKRVDPTVDWYICKIAKRVISSPAENIIKKILKAHEIEFYCEVSFKGFGNKCQPYRFDFWIPSMNMIIEYDGIHHTNNKRVMNNDIIKNNFCKFNKIKLYRLNKKDWNTLELSVIRLVKRN